MSDKNQDRERRLRELVSDVVEVVVDKIGWRGEGLVRFADGWLSIRGVHAGETIRARCASRLARPGKLYGTLEEVISPSPSRVDPECANFPRCAGCHLRHYNRADELEFKRRAILEILEKFTDFHIDNLPEVELVTGGEDGVRRRGSLTRIDENFGLRIPGEDAVIDMSECPALTPEARRFVASLTEILVEEGAEISRVDWAAGRDDFWVELDRELELGQERLESLGCKIMKRDRSDPSSGATIEVQRLGRGLEESPGAWSHTTTGPSDALYDWCREWMRDSRSLLDLGCGVGTVSLLAASLGFEEIVGVDASRTATHLARRNAERHDASAEFMTGDFEKAMRALTLNGDEFEMAVVNPMREPLGDRAVAYLDGLASRRVLYLAPSPAAGARDLERLRQRGWGIVRGLAAIDLHPKTYHVMLGMVLERGNRS